MQTFTGAVSKYTTSFLKCEANYAHTLVSDAVTIALWLQKNGSTLGSFSGAVGVAVNNFIGLGSVGQTVATASELIASLTAAFTLADLGIALGIAGLSAFTVHSLFHCYLSSF